MIDNVFFFLIGKCTFSAVVPVVGVVAVVAVVAVVGCDQKIGMAKHCKTGGRRKGWKNVWYNHLVFVDQFWPSFLIQSCF